MSTETDNRQQEIELREPPVVEMDGNDKIQKGEETSKHLHREPQTALPENDPTKTQAGTKRAKRRRNPEQYYI